MKKQQKIDKKTEEQLNKLKEELIELELYITYTRGYCDGVRERYLGFKPTN